MVPGVSGKEMLIGGCIDQWEFINAEYRFAENEIEDEQINHKNSVLAGCL